MSRITADNISSRSGTKVVVDDNLGVVGIVTSNSSVVGSAVTINSTGINVVGVVTATNFSGTFNGTLWNSITTTSVSKTLSNREFCVVTAGNCTITLPPSPSAGNEVFIGVGYFTNTIIGRNGSNIMGLAEDSVINTPNASINLLYVNASIGWRIV